MASELTGDVDEKAAVAGPITVTGSRLAEPTPGPEADVGESATPSPRISVISTASANDKPMIPRGGVAADALSTVRAGEESPRRALIARSLSGRRRQALCGFGDVVDHVENRGCTHRAQPSRGIEVTTDRSLCSDELLLTLQLLCLTARLATFSDCG